MDALRNDVARAVAEQNAAVERAFQPPVAEDDVASLASLRARRRRKSLHSDYAPGTERAYAHNRNDFLTFCGRDGARATLSRR